MIIATYTLAIEGTQVAASAALEEAILEPAVDTPQKEGPTAPLKLYIFPPFAGLL
jgi:hypothetical protein